MMERLWERVAPPESRERAVDQRHRNWWSVAGALALTRTNRGTCSLLLLVAFALALDLGRATVALADRAPVITLQEVPVDLHLSGPSGPIGFSGTADLVVSVQDPLCPGGCLRLRVLWDWHGVTATDSAGVEYHATNNVEFDTLFPTLPPFVFDFPGTFRFVAQGAAAAQSFPLQVTTFGAVGETGAATLLNLDVSIGGAPG
jgi:hypothetical protein